MEAKQSALVQAAKDQGATEVKPKPFDAEVNIFVVTEHGFRGHIKAACHAEVAAVTLDALEAQALEMGFGPDGRPAGTANVLETPAAGPPAPICPMHGRSKLGKGGYFCPTKMTNGKWCEWKSSDDEPLYGHYCEEHGTPFERHEKDGKAWYSHKMPNGKWCNEQ